MKYFREEDKDNIPVYQNVVLISKGWYDKEKYKTKYQALRAYQSKIVNQSEDKIYYDDVFKFLLLPTCEIFLSSNDLCYVLYELMFKEDLIFTRSNDLNLDAEYIVNLIMRALGRLSFTQFLMYEEIADNFKVV